jgi:hypothetical protein
MATIKTLLYNDLNTARVKTALARTLDHLENGNFRAADVRKMHNGPYYRAKLSDADRLLFRYGRCRGENCLLILEVIENHAYERSRFLNGATVDENKLVAWDRAEPAAPEEAVELPYINPGHARFHLLDKPLSFDNRQENALRRQPPVIVIGSAGSGKTALTVEKLKEFSGHALYTTLSPYLAENARNLYFAHHYDNPDLEIDFLSFEELLQSIKFPAGREVTFREFAGWFTRHRQSAQGIDAHPLFEEFRGVLTGWRTDVPYLSREDYLALGVRQSIFLGEQRAVVYNLFGKYISWMKESNLRDANMTAHAWLPLAKPAYDVVVIDEVQDLTNIQVELALATLKHPLHFVLCGDSNQIVHPNFFSWAHIKSLFYEKRTSSGTVEIAEVLDTNYRNTAEVTDLANRLLLIKNARFGSIDRESNYLVQSMSNFPGRVELISDDAKPLRELDEKTRRSTRYAVIALRDEDKAAARRIFQTPLVFSIQEAKGLEYDNIILYNVVSAYANQFDEIIEGVTASHLDKTDLQYARAKDKTDKSLDAYKFYINALYVAVTRSMRTLILVENRVKHRIFDLLELRQETGPVKVSAEQSSRDDWAREARRLEKQGKREQADLIRETMLGHQPVPWKVITPETLDDLKAEAFNPKKFNKQAKQLLFDFAILSSRKGLIYKLANHKFTRAQGNLYDAFRETERKYLRDVKEKNWISLRRNIEKHGIDFRDPLNHTPLMWAARAGDSELVKLLIELGADTEHTDIWGRTAFHHCLLAAFRSEDYSTRQLAPLYEALAPSHLSVKVDDRLIKLDAHTAEYFILNWMIATIEFVLCHKASSKPAFEAADFVFPLRSFPESVIPAYRKRRAYISSVLARNEIYRKSTGNRRLFFRVVHGQYLPHAGVELLVKDEWVPFYQLIRLDEWLDEQPHPMLIYYRDLLYNEIDPENKI